MKRLIFVTIILIICITVKAQIDYKSGDWIYKKTYNRVDGKYYKSAFVENSENYRLFIEIYEG